MALRQSRLALKSTALILSILLVIPPQVQAQLPYSNISLGLDAASLPITIPAHIGSISDSFIPAVRGNENKLVIYIQDAHTNFEAQKSIREILNYLTQEYGLKLVGAEGAMSPLQPDLLRFFKDNAKNSGIAERMVKKGDLSGVEWFAVGADKNIRVVGLEDASLYTKNIATFRDLIHGQKKAVAVMHAISSSLQSLKAKFYNPSLLQFDRKAAKGAENLFTYVAYLEKTSREELGIDFMKVTQQVQYPFVARLAYLLHTERNMNSEKISREKEALLKDLKIRLGSAAENETILTTLSKMIPGKSHDIDRSTHKTFGDFFKAFYDLGKREGVEFSVYENFREWASVLILQEEIQHEGLFEELDQLVERLYQHFAKTDREKSIIQISRDVQLLEKLVKGELTRKDYRQFMEGKENLESGTLKKRMEAAIGQDKDSAGLKKHFESRVNWKRFDEFQKLALDFYAVTLERDKAMVRNALAQMDRTGETKMAVVCGGFHTEGMAELFKDQNAGYLVVTPHVALEAEGTAKYHEAILENRKTIFDLSRIASVIKLVEDAFFSRLTGNLETRNKLIGEEALVAVVQEIQATVNKALTENPDFAKLLPQIAPQIAEAVNSRIEELQREFSSNPLGRNVLTIINPVTGLLEINVDPSGIASPIRIPVAKLAAVPVREASDLSRIVAQPDQPILAASLGVNDMTDITGPILREKYEGRVSPRMLAFFDGMQIRDLGRVVAVHLPQMPAEKTVSTRKPSPWEDDPGKAGQAMQVVFPFNPDGVQTDKLLTDWRSKDTDKFPAPLQGRIMGEYTDSNGKKWFLAPNNSPIFRYQTMIVPESARAQRPLNGDFQAVLEILDQIKDPSAIVGFNGLNTGASINSLHFQLFFGIPQQNVAGTQLIELPFFATTQRSPVYTVENVSVNSIDGDQRQIRGRMFSGTDYAAVDRVANQYMRLLEQGNTPYSIFFRRGEVYIVPSRQVRIPGLEILGFHTTPDAARFQSIQLADFEKEWDERSLPASDLQALDQKLISSLQTTAQSLGAPPYDDAAIEFLKYIVDQEPDRMGMYQDLVDSGQIPLDVLDIYLNITGNPTEELLKIYMMTPEQINANWPTVNAERLHDGVRQLLTSKDGYQIPDESMDLVDSIRIVPAVNETIRSGKIKINVKGLIADPSLVPMMNDHMGSLGAGTAMEDALWRGFVDPNLNPGMSAEELADKNNRRKRWTGNAGGLLNLLFKKMQEDPAFQPSPDDPDFTFDIGLLDSGLGTRNGVISIASVSKGSTRLLGTPLILTGLQMAKIIAYYISKTMPPGRYKIVVPSDNVILPSSKLELSFVPRKGFFVFVKDDNIDIANNLSANWELLVKLSQLGQYLLDTNGTVKDNGFAEKPNVLKLLNMSIENAAESKFGSIGKFYAQIVKAVSTSVINALNSPKPQSAFQFLVLPLILGQEERGREIWRNLYDVASSRSAEYPWISHYTLDSWNQSFDAAFKIARENPGLATVVDQLRPFLSTNSNAFFFVFDQNAVDSMLDPETGYMRDMSNPADGKIASQFTPATRSSDLDLSRHILTPMITDSLDAWMAKYTEAEAKLYPDPNDWRLLWETARQSITPKVGGLTAAKFGRFWGDLGRVVDLLDFIKRAVNPSEDPMAVVDKVLVRGQFHLPPFSNQHNSRIDGTLVTPYSDAYLIVDSYIKIPSGVRLVLGDGVVIDGSLIDLTNAGLKPGDVVRIPDGTTIVGSKITGPIQGDNKERFLYHVDSPKGFNFDALTNEAYWFFNAKHEIERYFVLDEKNAVILNAPRSIPLRTQGVSITSQNGKLSAVVKTNNIGEVKKSPVNLLATVYVKDEVVKRLNLPSNALHIGHNFSDFNPKDKTEPLFVMDSEGHLVQGITMGHDLFGPGNIADGQRNFEFRIALRDEIRAAIDASAAPTVTGSSLGVTDPNRAYAAAATYLNLANPEQEARRALLDAGVPPYAIDLLQPEREWPEIVAAMKSGKFKVEVVIATAEGEMSQLTAPYYAEDPTGVLEGTDFLGMTDWGGSSRPAGVKRAGNTASLLRMFQLHVDPTLPDGRPNLLYREPLSAQEIKDGKGRYRIDVSDVGTGSRGLATTAGRTKGTGGLGEHTFTTLGIKAAIKFAYFLWKSGATPEADLVVPSDNIALVSSKVRDSFRAGQGFYAFPFASPILPDVDKDGRPIVATLPDLKHLESLTELGHQMVNNAGQVDSFVEKPKPLFKLYNDLLSYSISQLEPGGKLAYFEGFKRVLHFQDIGTPNRENSPANRLLNRHHQYYLQETVLLNWLLPGPEGKRIWDALYYSTPNNLSPDSREYKNTQFRARIGSIEEWGELREEALDVIEQTIAKYGAFEFGQFVNRFVQRAKFTTANTFFFGLDRKTAEKIVDEHGGFRTLFPVDEGLGSPWYLLKNFNLDWSGILLTAFTTSADQWRALHTKSDLNRDKDGLIIKDVRNWMHLWELSQNVKQTAGGFFAAPFGEFWFDTGMVRTFYNLFQMAVSSTDPVNRILIRAMLQIPPTQTMHNSKIVSVDIRGTESDIQANTHPDALISNSVIKVPKGVQVIIEKNVFIDHSVLDLKPLPGQTTIIIPEGTVIARSNITGQLTGTNKGKFIYQVFSDRGLDLNFPERVLVSLFIKQGKYPADDPGAAMIHVGHGLDSNPKSEDAIYAVRGDNGQSVQGFTLKNGQPGISFAKHLFGSAQDGIADPNRNVSELIEHLKALKQEIAQWKEATGASLGVSPADDFTKQLRGGILPFEQVRALREDPAALAAVAKAEDQGAVSSEEGAFWGAAKESHRSDFYDRYAGTQNKGSIAKIWKDLPKDPASIRPTLEYYAKHPELKVRYLALGLSQEDAQKQMDIYMDYFRNILGVKEMSRERFQIVGVPDRNGAADVQAIEKYLSRNFDLAKEGAVLVADDKNLLEDISYLGQLYRVHEHDKKSALLLEMEAALFAGNLKEIADKNEFSVNAIIDGNRFLSVELLAAFLDIQRLAEQRIAAAA